MRKFAMSCALSLVLSCAAQAWAQDAAPASTPASTSQSATPPAAMPESGNAGSDANGTTTTVTTTTTQTTPPANASSESEKQPAAAGQKQESQEEQKEAVGSSAIPPATMDTESEGFGMLYTLETRMLGHAAMARDALAFGLYSEAGDAIDMAQKEAVALAERTPQFNAKYAPRTASGNPNAGKDDYLFPVTDNTAVLEDIHAKDMRARHPKLDVASAQKINYMLFIDTRQAKDALTAAQGDMKDEKYGAAMADLQKIGNGAALAATIYDRPLEAARDNLLLAREMVHNKQYKNASYALEHTKQELKRARRTDPELARSKATRDLDGQINELQTTLAQDNPSLLQDAEHKISEWVKAVEAHMHGKNQAAK